MSWRLLLPALLLTARHTTTAQPTHPTIPTSTPSQPPQLANNPLTNPYASSYYHHPPPPPSASYHWSNADTLLAAVLRTAVLALVHGFCALHQRLNTLHLYGLPSLHQHVLSRPPGTALLTLSNHTSTLDDPYVVTALLPLSQLLSSRQRHGWCAADICFRRDMYGPFFRLGRIFPVQRGAGLYQTGMTEALSYLVEGGWVHIFPEGKCNPHQHLQPLRWGTAKLLVSTLSLGIPITVLPVIHAGMEHVLPLHTYVPRGGVDVWVEVGECVDVAGVVAGWRSGERGVVGAGVGGWGDPWPVREEELYVAVNAVLEAAMRRTEQKLKDRMAAAAAAAASTKALHSDRDS